MFLWEVSVKSYNIKQKYTIYFLQIEEKRAITRDSREDVQLDLALHKEKDGKENVG